jgi:hypothetical protein
MATSLFTPVLNDRTRAPYFFNGRLLTGEAMTDEQRAQHAAHEILARGVGDGVAYGMEVAVSTPLNTVGTPIVSVKAGAAVSRRGDLLYLASDTDVQLVRPAHASASPTRIFESCQPPQQGAYVADAGVYLLTIAPVGVGDGLAPVSGLSGTQSCNVKYRVDAVQFRLVELPVEAAVLSDANRLRNRVAYACFGTADTGSFARDPFASTEPATPLDKIRGKTLADCEVPLAVLYWTATGGIRFVDMWSVRRRLAASGAATSFPALGERHLAVAEAMVRQFQEHVETLRHSVSLVPAVAAATYFNFLPPVGVLPIATPTSTGFVQGGFFKDLTVRGPAYVEGARLTALVREAIPYRPIDTSTPELVWLYLVRENRQAIDRRETNAPLPALAFVSGHVPYAANARFDIARWDYANFAEV